MTHSEHTARIFLLIILGQVENSETLEIPEIPEIFSKNFKSEFSILAVGQNRKVGNKKTRNNISDIFEISNFSEFSIWHVFINKKFFFIILKYRTSHSYMFLKIGVLKNFAIFIGKQLCWSLFFKRLVTYQKRKKDSTTGAFLRLLWNF